ncbi:ROK family protein [Paenibacillus sp. sgz302251]|uniref:ROK family protein n=1 Tax=Paenibacillus sp. sgz302251 TaxID=3414493 RepID=UPI003C7D9405
MEALKAKNDLTLKDIRAAIQQPESVSVELVRESGAAIGRVIASLVNFYNPSLISIGGSFSEFGDIFLASLRQGVYQRSLPLATRDLRINKLTVLTLTRIPFWNGNETKCKSAGAAESP